MRRDGIGREGKMERRDETGREWKGNKGRERKKKKTDEGEKKKRERAEREGKERGLRMKWDKMDLRGEREREREVKQSEGEAKELIPSNIYLSVSPPGELP